MISCSVMPCGGEESSSPSPRCAAADAIRKREKTASKKRQAEIRGTLIEVPVFIVFDRNPLKWECCGEKKGKENDRAGLESILLELPGAELPGAPPQSGAIAAHAPVK